MTAAHPVSGFRRRAPTAIAYGAVVLVAVFSSPWGAALWGLLALLAYRELARLTGASAPGGALLVAGLVLAQLGAALQPAALAVLALGAAALAVDVRRAGGRARAGWTAVGALWIGGLVGLVASLGLDGGRGTAAGGAPVWALLALGVTWAADVAAWAVGSRWGRRRLWPAVSPGKTWEGTLGGCAAALAVALAAVPLAGVPLGAALVVGVLGGPAGLAGDLAESALKRRAGAKDSGALLPGHGGVFDRIDSLLFVAPVVAFAARALAA